RRCIYCRRRRGNDMKEISSDHRRNVLIIVGVFLGMNALFMTIVQLYSGTFLEQSYMWINYAVILMIFELAYLQPQFKENDERSKKIKEKGMFFSYFFILGYLMIFLILLNFDMVALTALQVTSMLTALMIATVFTSFVALSFRY